MKIVSKKHATGDAHKHKPGPAAAAPLLRKMTPGTRPKPAHATMPHARPRPAAQKTPEAVTPATFFSTRYKLLELISKGGGGTVYKAEDRMLGLAVAIKVLPERVTRDRPTMARFKHEAGIALQLSHENIVKLHNLEMDRNRVFLVMEFVDGRDFRRILSSHSVLPLVPVMQVVKACAKALDYAHSRGVIHMDLKPENLMLTTESTLKIVDFGTAHRIDTIQAAGRTIVEGSPPYMSPEQLRGEPLDARTDVYSLGAIAYELVSGNPPVPVDADIETMLAARPGQILSLPGNVSDVICRALEKNREHRWRSAGEFYRELLRAHEESGASPAKP
ncbi:MAG: serine/threonine-protein kinase [bacterium]